MIPNTKAPIQIATIETDTTKDTVVVISEQPVKGGGITQTAAENTIYHASIVYEF